MDKLLPILKMLNWKPIALELWNAFVLPKLNEYVVGTDNTIDDKIVAFLDEQAKKLLA